jgi:hypothetical protein
MQQPPTIALVRSSTGALTADGVSNGQQRGFGAQIAIDPGTSKWIGSGPIGRPTQHRRGKASESGLWRVRRVRPYKQEVGGSSPSPPMDDEQDDRQSGVSLLRPASSGRHDDAW